MAEEGDASGAAHVKRRAGIFPCSAVRFAHRKFQAMRESSWRRDLFVDGNFPGFKGLDAEFRHDSAESASAGFRGVCGVRKSS